MSRVFVAGQPIVQLGSHGTVVHADAAELDALRAQFALQNYVRLPQLLGPGLLERVLRSIENGVFEDNRHKDIALEVCLSGSDTAAVMLQFVANSPSFFEVISQITQCGPIGCFIGRVNRRLAELGHFDNWHSDNVHSRVAAMTVESGSGASRWRSRAATGRRVVG